MSDTHSFQVPPALTKAILSGRCVAFVGAGFSADAVPTWTDLLTELARGSGEVGLSDRVSATLEGGANALDYEACGQLVRQAFGTDEAFEQALQRLLESEDARTAEGRTRVAKRVALLRQIPFDAILTTNYDAFPAGETPSAELYARVLRTERYWWQRSMWDNSTDAPTSPVVKLHGSANGDPRNNPVVLAREDYRRLVYENGTYRNFIKTVLATRTVLFLGVSFTDAYLNELRSEVLAMLSSDGDDTVPLAFAVLGDKTAMMCSYFHDHERVQVLNYASGPNHDHSGFDRWLEAVRNATAVRARLRRLVEGRRVVWIDAKDADNALGMQILDEATGQSVTRLTSPSELRPEHFEADLLITRMGYRSAKDATAYEVLEQLRGEARRPPVVVFASGLHAKENRREVLRRGAWEFASGWPELFRMIEVLFDG